MITKRQQQLALQLAGGASQRWLKRKVRYRPPGEIFDPRFATVAPIDERTARDWVCLHHYSGTYPAARFRAGIFIKEPYRRERMGGCTVFSVSMTNAVVTRWLDVDDPLHGIELGRLVLLDEPLLATNAETWFLARAFRLLRDALPAV